MTKPQCPKCGTELNEEFGMVTCSGCGSVLFIDFEGQAQLAAEQDSPAVESEASPSPNDAHSAHESSSVDESLIESFSNYESMTPMGGEIAGENEPPIELAEPSSSQNETPGDPIGLSAYANSEASQATGGPLAYTLHIEGLDSKELRESLREALGESRFNWDSGALMATIREGKLRLSGVEPVKASVLVNRLKRLPLKIWWEQNVVTDSNP